MTVSRLASAVPRQFSLLFDMQHDGTFGLVQAVGRTAVAKVDWTQMWALASCSVKQNKSVTEKLELGSMLLCNLKGRDSVRAG